MKASYYALLPVFMVLVSSTLAADPSCLNITLPNLLNIGTCLNKSGNICSDTSEGALALVTNLLGCVLSGIANLNVGTQLKLIKNLIIAVVNKIGLGLPQLVKQLYKLCESSASSVLNCKVFQVSNMTCDDPITINLPSVLNLGKCAGTLTSVCENGAPVTTDILTDLFNFLTCLVTSLLDANLGSTLNGLICSIFNVVSRIAGSSGPALKLLIETILEILGSLNC